MASFFPPFGTFEGAGAAGDVDESDYRGGGYVSMGVICYASDVKEYSRRRLEISNAPLHMKQDTTSL